MIQQIETLRGSRIVVYVTADRPDLGGQIGQDTISMLFQHLEAIGHQPLIDLFLYTRGGNTLAPSRIIESPRVHRRLGSVGSSA